MADQNEIDIAVMQAKQAEMDRRQETFMTQLGKTVDEINSNIAKTWNEINSLHGHINRAKEELREEVDRDFVSKEEGEKIRSSIKEINTKLYMTGIGIVLAVSMVQILIAWNS